MKALAELGLELNESIPLEILLSENFNGSLYGMTQEQTDQENREHCKRIAESIARYLCALLPGRAETVQKRGDLYILTATRAPWVLCECGFITNPGDVQAGPDAIAEAIARGILKYEGRGTKDEF